MKPLCPHPHGSAQAFAWWDAYFSSAIPAAVSRLDQERLARGARLAAQHGHIWDEPNRRCWNCWMEKTTYQDSFFGESEPPLCPVSVDAANMNANERAAALELFYYGATQESGILRLAVATAIREAVNDALERAAEVADLGVPSRDWSEFVGDAFCAEDAVAKDIAAGIRNLKEPTP